MREHWASSRQQTMSEQRGGPCKSTLTEAVCAAAPVLRTDSDQVKQDVAWRGVVAAVHEGRVRHRSVADLRAERLVRILPWERSHSLHRTPSGCLTSSRSRRSLFRAPTGLLRSLNVAAFVRSGKRGHKTVLADWLRFRKSAVCDHRKVMRTHPAVRCCSRRGPRGRQGTERGHCSCGPPGC